MSEIFDNAPAGDTWDKIVEGDESAQDGAGDGREQETGDDSPVGEEEIAAEEVEESAKEVEPETVSDEEELDQDIEAEAESNPEKGKAPPPGFVESGALREERGKRQHLEGQVQALQEQINAFTQVKEPATDPAAELNKLVDQGYSDEEAEGIIQQRAMQTELEESRKFREDTIRDQNIDREIRQINAAYETSVAEFVKTTPDLNDARQHARDMRGAQLRIAYPEATDMQINEQIDIDELALKSSAIRGGRDPADVIYQYAKANGYAGTFANNENGDGSGGGDSISRIAKGQEKSKTAAKGKSVKGAELTEESLIGKKGKEFDEGWNELFGGTDSIFD